MNDAGFHGVFPYIVSPVKEGGEIHAEVLARLCDDLEEVRRALSVIGALQPVCGQ